MSDATTECRTRKPGQVACHELIAPSANFAISAAIAHALLAKLLLVEARLPQFSTFTSIVVAMVRIYSDTARPNLNFL
jgi:hypothetical protein